jgi:hypothetical protein
MDDRVVGSLPMYLGQHHVRLAFGEEAAAGDRRQLGGIAENEDRRPEGKKVATDLGIDHRALVDDDETGLARHAVVVEDEGRPVLVLTAHAIDEAVDGAGAGATLGPEDMGGLAREGGEHGGAGNALGDMPGERRLAGTGIAKEPKDLRVTGLQPCGDGDERAILFG